MHFGSVTVLHCRIVIFLFPVTCGKYLKLSLNSLCNVGAEWNDRHKNVLLLQIWFFAFRSIYSLWVALWGTLGTAAPAGWDEHANRLVCFPKGSFCEEETPESIFTSSPVRNPRVPPWKFNLKKDKHIMKRYPQNTTKSLNSQFTY